MDELGQQDHKGNRRVATAAALIAALFLGIIIGRYQRPQTPSTETAKNGPHELIELRTSQSQLIDDVQQLQDHVASQQREINRLSESLKVSTETLDGLRNSFAKQIPSTDKAPAAQQGPKKNGQR
jgi:uncharacterized protein HemX